MADDHSSFKSSIPTQDVPLRTGPPIKEELLAHYPAKFTWNQLKTFINSGDLGLLKRDRKLQQRYDVWIEGIKEKYGSVVNYLLKHRLQWGKPDTISLLVSTLDDKTCPRPGGLAADAVTDVLTSSSGELPPVPPNAYFTADPPSEFVSIIQNDWPYSVPPEIEHTLIWTRLPIFHPALVTDSITARVEQDGLWGFTGNSSPPPSPSTLPLCLPALAEWGVTIEGLVRSEKCTAEEETMIRRAGEEVHNFVKRRWVEEEWETACIESCFHFPSCSRLRSFRHLVQRLQSVPGIAHIHVFARHKLPQDVARDGFLDNIIPFIDIIDTLE